MLDDGSVVTLRQQMHTEGEMSPESEIWAVEPWGQVIEVLTITAEDLEANPDYGVAILNFALHERRRCEEYRGIEDPLQTVFRELEFLWIYGERLWGKDSSAAIYEDDYLVQPGRKGRPVTQTRRAAMNAYVRRLYLKKKWLEIVRRVCPCGGSHLDSNSVVASCQPKLEVQVMALKRLLKKCEIQLSGELPAKAILPTDY